MHKQLTGQLESTDKELLIDWLANSQGNRETQQDISHIWELSKNYEPSFQPNVDQAYERFAKRIKSSPNVSKATIQETKTGKIRAFRGWMRYAAIGVILLASVAIWQFYKYNNVTEIMVSTIDDEIRTLDLADGSKIWLNERSVLNYPDKFRGSERVVELEGEGYFDIVSNYKRPFVVKGGAADVRVIGTSFNLNTHGNNSLFEVEVKEGTVEIVPIGSDEKLILTENERGYYDTNNKKFLEKELLKSSNADYFVTNKYSFIDSKYTYVFNILSKVYDVEFEFADDALETCTFTSPIEFDRDNIQATINVIESAYKHRNLEITRQEEGKYLISGTGCN